MVAAADGQVIQKKAGATAYLAANLVYHTLFHLQVGDPADEGTARRLVGDFRCSRAITPPSPVTFAEQRP